MCGVFGALVPGGEAARVAALGLFALQHRGQESAGLAVSDGEQLMLYKDLGLVSQVLDERRLPSLRGELAIAHCRYSTTGSTVWQNAQPTLRLGPRRAIAVGHNGNLVNTRELLDRLPGGRTRLPATTDTELLTALLADDPSSDLVDALCHVLQGVHGAYSLVVLDERRIIGVRDPFGFRPLVLGKLPPFDGTPDYAQEVLGLVGEADRVGWVLSSETAGLDIVGAEYVRDVEPGEIVILERGCEPRSVRFAEARPATCVFELIYFARPEFLHGGPEPLRGTAPDGDGAGGGAPGRRRPGHARARHRCPGGRRLRGGVGNPVSGGHGPQPLCGPDVHPALPGDAPAWSEREAQPAARGGPGPAPHRR